MKTAKMRHALSASALIPLLASAVLALLAVTPPAQAAGRNPNPGVMPINSSPFGKSYGQWGADWWIWAYSTPVDQNPIQDPTGAYGSQNQSGPVWFLAGNFGGTTERTITIPAGKGLFFPIFNIFADYPCPPEFGFEPAPGQSLEEFLTEAAAAFIDPATALGVEVDGIQLEDLWSYRATSSLVTFSPNPSWSALDPCVGVADPMYAVADGYWVMLAPLKKGEHTIRITAEAAEFGFSLDVTYHLTVK
jgi:hypothetical protein